MREKPNADGTPNREQIKKAQRFIKEINRALWVPEKLDDWAVEA